MMHVFFVLVKFSYSQQPAVQMRFAESVQEAGKVLKITKILLESYAIHTFVYMI